MTTRSVASRLRSRRWRVWLVVAVASAAMLAPPIWAAARGVYAKLAILSTIVRLARDVYVDEVDPDRLMDGAIDGLLDNLDPHSNYLTPEEAARFGERIRGSFGGVGIHYAIIEGLPTVTSVIEGGPAEHAGLLSGDRIVAVDGVTTLNWREAEVQDHLKGALNTKVVLLVARTGRDTPLAVEIVRGTIPLKSVPYAFLLDDTTGYIRISNFAQTTGQEVGEALARLSREGMRTLLLDLRDNGGGDLSAAVAVADFFLQAGTVVVSQRGRWEQANQTYHASASPGKSRQPVVVMINHGSASASEIVAGALQDTDRGLVVGQRSFGKGLVQRQFDLSQQAGGGGVLLLTIARYYTPTGRLIQRDYSAGTAQYIMEGVSDSSASDSARGAAFTTPLGRVMYGGGGIRPDVTIPRSRTAPVVVRFFNSAIYFRFADEYSASAIPLPATYEAFLRTDSVRSHLFDTFVRFAKRVDPTQDESEIYAAKAALMPHIVGGLAERKWGSEYRYRVLASSDPEILAAREYLAESRQLLHRSTAERINDGR